MSHTILGDINHEGCHHMKTIGAFAAKTTLSRLLQEVESGESYVIERRGRPIARLTGVNSGDRRREIGMGVLERARKRRADSFVNLADIQNYKKIGRSE